MNKKITIVVTGATGTGKSLISRYIEEFLASKGLMVDRILEDDDDCWDDSMNEAKLLDLKDDLEIVIKSHTLRRGGIFNSVVNTNDRMGGSIIRYERD
jgi:dephospho-CoA kinase